MVWCEPWLGPTGATFCQDHLHPSCERPATHLTTFGKVQRLHGVVSGWQLWSVSTSLSCNLFPTPLRAPRGSRAHHHMSRRTPNIM